MFGAKNGSVKANGSEFRKLGAVFYFLVLLRSLVQRDRHIYFLFAAQHGQNHRVTRGFVGYEIRQHFIEGTGFLSINGYDQISACEKSRDGGGLVSGNDARFVRRAASHNTSYVRAGEGF